MDRFSLPLISIIIPVHDRADLLPETLDSVRAQTFTDWECIIVDDHSQDKSFDVAARYAKKDSRFIAVRLPDNKRFPSAARNYGLSLSRGDYVSFLDSDDLFLPEKLQLQIEEFERDKSLDMVTCRHSIFQDDCRSEIRKLKFAGKPYWLDISWYADYFNAYGGLWCTNGPIWRKKAIYSIGLWDENLTDWEDVELNIRAILAGINIIRVEKVLVLVREGTHQRLTTSRPPGNKNVQESIMKAWGLLSENDEITELRRRMVSFRLYSIARSYSNNIGLKKGVTYLISSFKQTGQNPTHTLYGLLSLVFSHFHLSRKLGRLFRNSFFKSLEQLPNIQS